MANLYPNDPPGRPVSLYGSQAKYWVYGGDQQPVIVVVHGYRGTHHGLISLIEHLPDYRFIVPDLPGFGESTPMTEQPHNMEGYARFVLGLIHELRLGPIILLGHSMGTTVAAEMLAMEPNLATRLILINSIAENPLSGLGRFKM